ncbi:MAG: PIN domain protein [Leptospiraceae bacterium]|nr:PIN domain protein [Leptospiraceae bacterium]
MLIYLDNYCFNRPYDIQGNIKVQIETESKLFIQTKIKEGQYSLIWSYILEYENQSNPYVIRKEEILEWKKISTIIIKPSEEIFSRAEKLLSYNIKFKDAMHLSCAIEAKADYFITTDNPLIKKKSVISDVEIINPINFIENLEV